MIDPAFSARPGRIVSLLVPLMIPGLVQAGCAPPGGGEAGTDVVVAVPVAPLAGLVDAVAPGSGVTTVVLVPPGANPATHEPALEELRQAASAHLYLELGHPSFVFERTWLAGLLEGASAERIAVFEGCPFFDEDYHVWMSADCLRIAADRVADTLTSLLPGSAAEIEANRGEFARRLAAADSATAARLGPLRGRSFLVLHPAWGYLTRPHDLTQLSILSHGTGDPGPARIAELIRLGRAEGIRLVLVQPQFNQAPARIVAEELGAVVVSLDPLTRDPLRGIDEATSTLERALRAVEARR